MKIPNDLQDRKDILIINEKLPTADDEQLYGKGYNEGVAAAFDSEHVKALVEALRKLEMKLDFNEYDLFRMEFHEMKSICRQARANWEKRNEVKFEDVDPNGIANPRTSMPKKGK